MRLIDWLQKMATQDRETFWREWHRKRRQKRLAYYERKLKQACKDVLYASDMCSYYEQQLGAHIKGYESYSGYCRTPEKP